MGKERSTNVNPSFPHHIPIHLAHFRSVGSFHCGQSQEQNVAWLLPNTQRPTEVLYCNFCNTGSMSGQCLEGHATSACWAETPKYTQRFRRHECMAWIGFSGGLGSTGLMLVLNDLKNLSQSNHFYYSVILNAVFL